ncbi:hypothetical protein PR202_gb00349 [Eleusine coracana subsp. coracana]|uniref:Proteasome assembly chaperone 3 n=1 Tax=Eleusine coracana subsp. coracana TaxID=191504 RepID=A0AAV5DTN1_ELECO|nr:hypothetical protein PR202_gb00349 [Eleusine coracana subsp. coracana]
MSSEEMRASFSELAVGSQTSTDKQTGSSGDPSSEGVQVTCFTEDIHDVTLHFQIIRLSKQDNRVSVTSVLGGTSDNTGSSMARRLVLKTGLNIVLACNIPKDSPMLEAAAERKLVEKLRGLSYIKPKAGEASASNAH